LTLITAPTLAGEARRVPHKMWASASLPKDYVSAGAETDATH
jgi:hypothetical protein